MTKLTFAIAGAAARGEQQSRPTCQRKSQSFHMLGFPVLKDSDFCHNSSLALNASPDS